MSQTVLALGEGFFFLSNNNMTGDNPVYNFDKWGTFAEVGWGSGEWTQLTQSFENAKYV